MINITRLGLLITGAICGFASAVDAQTFSYLSTNTTINSLVTQPVIIGYANAADYNNKANGASPAITVVQGGFIAPSGSLPVAVSIYNHSAFNLSGGAVNGSIAAYDNSTTNLVSNRVANVYTYNNAALNITGGGLSNIYARDASSVNISGSTSLYLLNAYNQSSITIHDGYIGGGVVALNNSAVDIYDSMGIERLIVKNSGSANVRGGSITSVSAGDDGIISITGGFIDNVGISGNAVLNINGGRMNNSPFAAATMFVSGSAVINLAGTNLNATLTTPDYYINSSAHYSIYTLSGNLTDGASIAGRTFAVEKNGGARVVFNGALTITGAVPEPGSVALLISMTATGGIMAFRRRINRS